MNAAIIAPQPMLQVTCAILAIWGIVNSAQWLADIRQWRDGTAIGWDLQRLRRRGMRRFEILLPLFGPTGIVAISLVQLAISFALLLFQTDFAAPFILSGLIITTLLLTRRSGADGGDKMALVALTGALLQSIGVATESHLLLLAGIVWTGGQLTMAYFASGATKLLIRRWRNGEALSAALSSDMWGHPRLGAFLQSQKLAFVAAWIIMLAETAFPIALFLPPAWLISVLAGFLLLHLAIARVMGLNLYVWAFLAAYPSVLLLSHWLGRIE